jgi:hypothetical protein
MASPMTPEEMRADFENFVEGLLPGFKEFSRDRDQFALLAGVAADPYVWRPDAQDLHAVLGVIATVNQGPASAPERT